MNLSRVAIAAGLFWTSLTANLASAQQAPSSAPPVIFTPPAVGAPADRVGASTRQAASDESEVIEMLAPTGGGYTLRETPKLYWRVSGPLEGSLRFDLRAHGSDAPILTVFRNDGVFNGIGNVDLGVHRVLLEPRKLYVWSITLLTPDGRRLMGRSFIERVKFSSAIMNSIDQTSAASLATYGVWYDALDLLVGRASIDGSGQGELESFLSSGLD